MRLFCSLLSLILVAACGGDTEGNNVTELIKQDGRVGTGAEVADATDGAYTVWLFDRHAPITGNKFDSSRVATSRRFPLARPVIPAGIMARGDESRWAADLTFHRIGMGLEAPRRHSPNATLLFDFESSCK